MFSLSIQHGLQRQDRWFLLVHGGLDYNIFFGQYLQCTRPKEAAAILEVVKSHVPFVSPLARTWNPEADADLVFDVAKFSNPKVFQVPQIAFLLQLPANVEIRVRNVGIENGGAPPGRAWGS